MRWTPPFLNEPHEARNGTPLIQEQYFSDENSRWKMLVTCLSLNLTSGKQARQVLPLLFETYPDPISLSNACPNRLYDILKPLGMVNKRVVTYRRFSDEYVNKPWNRVKQLYGCGQYAQDSDDIFWSGQWQVFTCPHSGRELKDSELRRYVQFVNTVYNNVALEETT